MFGLIELNLFSLKTQKVRAVAVAQLVEKLLLRLDIRGSNPNIGKFYLPIVQVIKKYKNKGKEAENGPSLLKKN